MTEPDLFSGASRRALIVETDGGARGNPGPAGFGAVVRDAITHEVLVLRADYLGHVTNNVAEYTGLIEGLQAAREIDPEAQVEVRADSKLVVEQMSGRWKIKHADMQALARRARLAFPPERVRYTWVPREKNKQADRLANQAMDERRRIERIVGDQAPDGAPQADDDARQSDEPAGTHAGEARSTTWQPEPAGRGGDAANSAPPAARNRPSGSRMRFDQADPVTLVLVRHGETEMTQRRAYSGSVAPGPSLSSEGRAQAERAADAVATIGTAVFTDLYPVSKVLASPLARTSETAAIIARRLGMVSAQAPDFVEANFGQWEGLEPEQIESGWPGSLRDWHRGERAAPNGESLGDVGRRVQQAVTELAESFAGRTVVVCSHVIAIRAALGATLGVEPHAWSRLRVSPGSLSVVRLWPDHDGEIVTANWV